MPTAAHKADRNRLPSLYRHWSGYYQRALLFLYLNRHCYNGLCRYNLRGEFNVPFGRYRKPYFPEAELLWFAERAQKATFVCESYDVTLTNAGKGSG